MDCYSDEFDNDDSEFYSYEELDDGELEKCLKSFDIFNELTYYVDLNGLHMLDSRNASRNIIHLM